MSVAAGAGVALLLHLLALAAPVGLRAAVAVDVGTGEVAVDAGARVAALLEALAGETLGRSSSGRGDLGGTCACNPVGTLDTR